MKVERDRMNEFIEYISSITELSDEEVNVMLNSFPVKEFEKGTTLINEGKIVNNAFYIIQGCVRKFCIIDGEEKTIDFYTEGQAAIDFDSILNQEPSKFYLSCLESSKIVIVNTEKEKDIYNRFPRFENISRKEAEKLIGKEQKRISDFMTSTPEQRYLALQENRPDLLQRVPLRLLASYIGVSPESLSRIRRRLVKKT